MRDSVQKNLRLTNFRITATDGHRPAATGACTAGGTANRGKKRERRLIVWPMGMVLNPLTPLAPVQSRLQPSLPRRNEMKAGLLAFSLFKNLPLPDFRRTIATWQKQPLLNGSLAQLGTTKKRWCPTGAEHGH